MGASGHDSEVVSGIVLLNLILVVTNHAWTSEHDGHMFVGFSIPHVLPLVGEVFRHIRVVVAGRRDYRVYPGVQLRVYMDSLGPLRQTRPGTTEFRWDARVRYLV